MSTNRHGSPGRLSLGEMTSRTEAVKALGISPGKWSELVATGMKVIRLDPGLKAKQHVETDELFKAMDRLSAAYDVLRYWSRTGVLEEKVERIREEVKPYTLPDSTE